MRPKKYLCILLNWGRGKYFYNSRHFIFIFISPEVVIVTVENGIRSDNSLFEQEKKYVSGKFVVGKIDNNFRRGGIYKGRATTRSKGILLGLRSQAT